MNFSRCSLMPLPLADMAIGTKRIVIFGASSSTNSVPFALSLNHWNSGKLRRFSSWVSIYDSNQPRARGRILSLLRAIAKCARERAMPEYAEHEVEFWWNELLRSLPRSLSRLDRGCGHTVVQIRLLDSFSLVYLPSPISLRLSDEIGSSTRNRARLREFEKVDLTSCKYLHQFSNVLSSGRASFLPEISSTNLLAHGEMRIKIFRRLIKPNQQDFTRTVKI